MVTAREFVDLHSILSAIVEKELGCPLFVPEEAKPWLACSNPDAPVPESAVAWLLLLDLAVNPHLLRKQMKQSGAHEETVQALLRFLVGKKTHSQADRDKVDWLATFFFQAREERTKQPTGWPKAIVQEILKGFEFPPLTGNAEDLLTEVSSLLEEVKYFDKFAQITESRIIARGRELKNRFGEELFHPDVLAATINYNLIFGKKFHLLLKQTMEKVRHFATHAESSPGKDLLHDDYRSTGDAMQHLSQLGLEQETVTAGSAGPTGAQGAPGTPQGSAASVAGQTDNRFEELGISLEMEALNVRKRADELGVRLKANPNLTTLPGAVGSLVLTDWETAALRSSYPESEQSFRADFARAIVRALAIVSLINDEMPAYQAKKSTEYLWKRHYDTLFYLLQEGSALKDRLFILSSACEKKGLIDKAKQLLVTAQKLQGALRRATTIFED